jgi:diacylglycerol kinase family enzyme
VADLAQQYAGETCRFYACGGDGTLNEVAAGAAGHPGAQVACFPCGTGNDFVKLFNGREHFRNIEDLIDGNAIPMDVMRVNDRYALNLCSVGFDARVSHWVGKNKRKLPFGGGLTYKIAILTNFFGQIYRGYRVTVDGRSFAGEYTIIVAANGRYYGGGFYAVPEAEPDDGLLDFLMIRRVSRARFLGCIGKYAEGRHPELGDIAFFTRGRSITLESAGPEPVNVDGEIQMLEKVTISFTGVRIPFVEPLQASLMHNETRQTQKNVEIVRLSQ